MLIRDGQRFGIYPGCVDPFCLKGFYTFGVGGGGFENTINDAISL